MRRPDNTILRSSSSSRHDNNAASSETNLHAKTIGCMSGILHLFSKHHTSRKFITFGKKQEKNACSSITKSTGGGEPSSSSSSVNCVERLSSNTVPRSPTLPADIRLSNSARSFRTPSAGLVARLMGLEQSSLTTSASTLIMPKTAVVPNKYSTTTTTTASTNQKRQQLLGALDKCDQDLKALKKIIDAVRAAEVLRSSPPPPSSTSAMNTYNGKIKSRFANNNNFKCLEVNGEQQPSPVSVLLDDDGYDEDDDDQGTTTRSTIRIPLSFGKNHYHYHYHFHSRKQLLDYERVQEAQQFMRQQQQIRKKKLGQEDFTDKMITTESSLPVALLQKESSASSVAQGGYTSSPLWNSKAMMESVAEVCRDIAWGERREIERIGFALQDHICKDLIQEIVTDVMECDPDTRSCGHSSLSLSLPFEACKRRLCF